MAHGSEKKLVAGAVVLSLLLGACGDDDGGSATNFDFSELERSIEEFVGDTPGIDGVGAILVHRDHGVIFQRSFGAFSDDRIYLVASASKTVSVGVLMRLADMGILDLDEPVIDAVPWGDHNPTVTPAQLVSNSSGLVGLLPNPSYAPYLCQYLYTGTLQDCARMIFTADADDMDVIAPDTDFRYGGGQWQVAGGVAEIVSGKSWASLVRETYKDPCGIDVLDYNNHFVQVTPPAEDAFGYPEGFDGDPSVLFSSDNPNIEGGVYTTVGDYGKFLLMQLRGGVCGDTRVLSEESVRRMQEDRIGPVYGEDTGFGTGGYGLGWWVIDEELVADPGAYGAFPWIDQRRAYAGFYALEATSDVGNLLFERTRELVERAVDAG